MLLPNPYGRGRWRTMLKIHKMDGKLPDLVQNIPKTEVSFPYTELIDHLLPEEIFLYCLNCFRTTGDENMLHCAVVYIDVYRNCYVIIKRRVQISIQISMRTLLKYKRQDLTS